MMNVSLKRWMGAWPVVVIVLTMLAAIAGAKLTAQTRAGYRDFALGSSAALILEQTHAPASDLARVHERPALIQELHWRPSYFADGTNEPRNDSVHEVTFSFVDDHLSRMAIDYDRLRTEGMTDADMVTALSERYGSPVVPTRPVAPVLFAPLEAGTAIASWQDGDVVAGLSRNTFTGGLRLIVLSKRLDDLARVDSAEAVRIETAAAPALELVRRQREADATRIEKEKARIENKATFRP